MENYNYVKLFVNDKVNIISELNSNELIVFDYLINFISEISCILEYKNGDVLTVDDISCHFDKTKCKINGIMNSLVKKEILARGKIGKNIFYIMNPYVCAKGDYVDNVVVDIFCETKWAN